MTNNDKPKTWELVGYVLASEYRIKILKYLNSGSALPKQISTKLKKSMSHTSHLLKGLENNGLIICSNPNVKKGRIYNITDLGEAVNKIVVKIHTQRE